MSAISHGFAVSAAITFPMIARILQIFSLNRFLASLCALLAAVMPLSSISNSARVPLSFRLSSFSPLARP